MCARCGAICLIALFVASSDQKSNQERGMSRDAKYCVSTRGAAPLHAFAYRSKSDQAPFVRATVLGASDRAISKSLIHKRPVATAPGTVLMAPGPI
jgi:hypothetical protein